MSIPIVKEHGSWAVFIFSCAAGTISGLLTRPWQAGREFSIAALFTVMGLVLLINSKSPLSSAIKAVKKNKHILWFAFFSLSGVVFLVPFFYEGLKEFMFFSPLVFLYVLLLFLGREHNLIAEINGFALLTLAAPMVYFVITGDMPLKLYLAVFVFFTAGVFKVRVRLKKSLAYRWTMVIYCAVSLLLFYLIDIPVLLLLPFAENVVYVIRVREEKLRMTGNIELIKGVVFTLLLGFLW